MKQNELLAAFIRYRRKIMALYVLLSIKSWRSWVRDQYRDDGLLWATCMTLRAARFNYYGNRK